MKIAVVDGQGGGLGKAIVEKIRAQIKSTDLQIIALGTNSLATSNMLKGGAHAGATGENAIRVTSKQVDMIIGPLAILMSNAMMGEITAPMAEAISESQAIKLVLPLNRCGVLVTGVKNLNMSEMIDCLLQDIEKHLDTNALSK